jgi:hypothetical protein
MRLILRVFICVALLVRGLAFADGPALVVPGASASDARIQLHSTNCPSVSSVKDPMSGLRHGLVISFTGIGHQKVMRVDFGSNSLTTLTSRFESINGHDTFVTCRRVVRLTSYDLVQIYIVTDSILKEGIPRGPGGLDESWAINFVTKGTLTRHEGGLGLAPGLGGQLAGLLAGISERAGP